MKGVMMTKEEFDSMTAAEIRRMQADSPAMSEQIGGDHYKTCAIQPVEFIEANGLGYCEGNVIKYVTRHRKKGGAEDLRKAKHYIDLLLRIAYDQTE